MKARVYRYSIGCKLVLRPDQSSADIRFFASLRRVLDIGGQATKGAWGMSRRQKAMKGVEGCEKLGGVVKRALIPGFPN